MTSPQRPNEAELNAYLDGELGPEAQAQVERHLAGDSEDARRVADYRAIQEAMHALYDPVLQEPVPERLAAATERRRSTVVAWTMRIAAALVLLVAGAAGGWFAHQNVSTEEGRQIAFTRQAIDAHRLYSVEVRHPVEVAAADEAHMSAWLTRRLGKAIAPPALGGAGFKLVGGRLLPSESKPAAQFMYENAGGQRLTLFFTVATGGGDAAAYRFVRDGGTQSLFWYIDGFACALTGEFEQKDLMAFAKEIYRSRGGDTSNNLNYSW
ncbi:MAG: anti-sigma factor [Alphaproteobacteria bacterium]|nr:anti-sigma factor [Alphaproteobacteria bacterium]